MDDHLRNFIVRAKRATYASGITPQFSSRPGSHDLHYEESPYLYIDTYLGGHHFIGEEIVWKDGVNIWGMNYYGKMMVDEVPSGFGDFLRRALMEVPTDNPYRGPEYYLENHFKYTCTFSGESEQFIGIEEIYYQNQRIYRLYFHGGEVKD